MSKPKSLGECVIRAYQRDRSKHDWLDTSATEWTNHLTDILVESEGARLQLGDDSRAVLREGIKMSELRRMARLGVREAAKNIDIAEGKRDERQRTFADTDPEGFGSIFTQIRRPRTIGTEEGKPIRIAPCHWQWREFERYCAYIDSRVVCLTGGQTENKKILKIAGEWWAGHPMTSWPEIIRRFGLAQAD